MRRNRTRNRIKCKMCDTILESKHRTDLQMCGCGVGVKGGLESQYLILPLGVKEELYEDLSEYENKNK
jgi:hypothetical protein